MGPSGSHPYTMVRPQLVFCPLGSHQFCFQVFLSGVDIILGGYIILGYCEVNQSVDKVQCLNVSNISADTGPILMKL